MLRLRRAWRRDPLPDRPARPAVHGCGQGIGGQGRDGGPRPRPARRGARRASAGLHDVMAAAQRWFAEQLHGIEGGAARDYLAKRGIDAATIERFGLGLAPDARASLKAALASHRRGQAGRDRHADQARIDGGETYDRFRGRLMIPIRDARGRVIAFGGRILGDGEPKYLNSPRHAALRQGPHALQYRPRRPASRSRQAADRRRRLYGRHRARPAPGSREVVAPNGTARDRGAARADVAARPPRRSAASTAMRRARRRRSARPCAPCPISAPSAPCASSPARGPGPRRSRQAAAAARRSRRCSPPPSPWSSACGGTSVEAAPLDHARGSARPEGAADGPCRHDRRRRVRPLYRDEWLGRFDALVRPRRNPSAAQCKPRQMEAGPARRLCPRPPRRCGQVARAIGAGGIDRATARALIAGFAHFPEAIARPCRDAGASCRSPIRRRAAARSAGRCGAWPARRLIARAFDTILEAAGAAPALKDVRRAGGIGFTFTRSDSDPERARARSGRRDRGVGGRGRNRSGARRGHGTAEGG